MNNLSKYLTPKVKSSGDQRGLSVRIPRELYEKTQRKAEKYGLSRTQLIRGLLEYYLESESDEIEQPKVPNLR